MNYNSIFYSYVQRHLPVWVCLSDAQIIALLIEYFKLSFGIAHISQQNIHCLNGFIVARTTKQDVMRMR